MDTTRPAPRPWASPGGPVPPDPAPLSAALLPVTRLHGPAPSGPSPYEQVPAATPPHDPRALRRRRRGRALLAGVGALALLAVAVAVVDERGEAAAPGAAAVRAQVDARLPALTAFVERERGLAFLAPVEVEVLDDDAFVEALFEPGPGEEEPAGDGEATLRALGLLDGDQELDEELDASLAGGVAGFYDPEDGRLVVRGTSFDAYAELVVVHELAHALQDQHFELSRPALLVADDERQLAFDALVEGDAGRVEQAWREAQPRAVQREIDDEEQRRYGDLDEGPYVVEVLLGFPYAAGPALVEQLLDEGGQAGLDAAFRDPPTTSEQVLRLGPAAPAVPAPGDLPAGDVVDEGVLGELGLSLALDLDPTGLEDGLGWAGDRYVTVDTEDGPCTVADVELDGAQERDRLVEALGEASYDAQARGPAGLRLTSCSG